MKTLFKLIERRQPHLIAINGENMDAPRLAEDVRQILSEESFQQIPVEIANNEAAKVYMNSRMALVKIKNNFL